MYKKNEQMWSVIEKIFFSDRAEARFSLSRKEFCYNPYGHGKKSGH
jgi:hypothetical protein